MVVGSEALWDPDRRTVSCLECPAGAPETALDAGIAGASAQREFERRRAAREARTRDRFGRLGGLVLALTDEPASTQAWARGAAGEEELARALDRVPGIHVLHDRRVPETRGNIDHIVVGPGGVFVVDAKRYQGLIRVRDVGGLLRADERLYVGSRDCSKLVENMGWQVEAVARALRSVPVEPLPPITPVLCFVHGEWPLLRPPPSFLGVRLESERSIAKLVGKTSIIDGDAIDRLAHVLAAAFPPK
jgi:hypothetical protein